MEAVSDPWFGQDISRFVGFRFYLSTQLLHENPKILHFVTVIRSPDRLQKFAMGNGLIRVEYQITKQIELFRCEACFAAANDEFAGLKVDLDVIEGDSLRSRLGR